MINACVSVISKQGSVSNGEIGGVEPRISGPGRQTQLAARRNPGIRTALVIAGGIVVDQGIVIIRGVHDPAELELFEIAHAIDHLGPVLGSGECGQQHCGKNRDNGDYHQQFDQGESSSGTSSLHY